MYRIKQKKAWSFLKFTIAFIFLAAFGLIVGYAGAKLSGQASEKELVQTPIAPHSQGAELSESKAASKSSIDEPVNSAPKKDEYLFLVRYEDGETKVFNISEDKKTFSHTLPIEPASLRQEDLTMLRAGVFLKTKDELLSFTEDFCS